MRILQLVHSPQRRGAEVFALQLSQQLDRRGEETRIVYLYPTEGDGGLSLRHQDRLLGGAVRHPLEKIPAFHPGLVARLIKEIRSFRPDIVQVNGSRTVKYGSLATRLETRRSWALIYRSIGNPRDWAGGRLRRAAYGRLVVARVDGVVGVSRRTLQVVRELYRIAAPSVCIPRGVDPEDLAPRQTRASLRGREVTPDASPVIIFAGSLTPEKRIDRLLRVFRQVSRSQPEARLWLVGKGPLRPELEQQAATLELSHAVRFCGARSDIGSYLNAADLLALTSDSEGLPGVLLEAGIAGLPVVATRVGGVGECVLDGETGFVVEAHDETGLADGLLRLIAEPELRRRMGQRARQWVSQRFSIDKIAERYLGFYRETLVRRRNTMASGSR